jgi:hypothetical protein
LSSVYKNVCVQNHLSSRPCIQMHITEEKPRLPCTYAKRPLPKLDSRFEPSFPCPARAQAALTWPPPPPPPPPVRWIRADSIQPAASSPTPQRCGRKSSAPPLRPPLPRKLKLPRPPPPQATVTPERKRAATGSARSGTPRLSPTGK